MFFESYWIPELYVVPQCHLVRKTVSTNQLQSEEYKTRWETPGIKGIPRDGSSHHLPFLSYSFPSEHSNLQHLSFELNK